MTYSGFTYTPDIAFDEQGREFYSGEGSLQSHSAQTVDVPYVEDPLTGQTRYLLEEEDFQQDEDYEYSDTHEQYVESLFEAYPQLSNAIAWAGSNWTEEQITAYDAAMDSEDLDELMPYIEHMLEEYEFALAEGSVEDPDAEPDPFDDVDDETAQAAVDGAFEELSETEPGGMETAYEYMELAVHYQDTEPVLSELYSLSAQFHQGSISVEDAFATALEKYSFEELAPAYLQLTGQD